MDLETFNTIKNNILSQNFDRAEIDFKKVRFLDFKDFIEIEAFDNPDIKYYEFIQFLITKDNKAVYHYWASELLSTALCILENAYEESYKHLLEAIKEDPANNDYLAKKLFYFSLPIEKQLLTKEEAVGIAKEVLEKNPEDETAKSFLGGLHLYD